METAEDGAAFPEVPPEGIGFREEKSTALIRRAQDGEEAALNELIESWRTFLLYVANGELEGKIKAKVGASDVVQSACLEIHRHFNEFRGDTTSEWKSWLRQLLLRDIQDVRRRYRETARRDIKREQRLDEGEGFRWEPEDEESSPRASLIAAEESNTLRMALQQLSEEHRQVLRYRNWDELAFAEIGRLLNRSEDAARKLWTRAVDHLQTELERITDES